jgi:hypothetical protein
MFMLNDFSLLVWRNHKETLIWAGLSPHGSTLEKFKDYTSSRSIRDDETFVYKKRATVLTASWCPLVLEESVDLALFRLERKLNCLPISAMRQDSEWSDKVRERIKAVDIIIDKKILAEMVQENK